VTSEPLETGRPVNLFFITIWVKITDLVRLRY
jgi:hypothetical protein